MKKDYNESKVLRDHEGLIRKTVSICIRNFRASRHSRDYDDYLQEAKIAAIRAYRNYRDDRKAKLSTYIVSCIKNHMIDLDRAVNRQKTPDLQYQVDNESVEIPTVACNPVYTIETYLSDYDARIFRLIKVKDTIAEVVSEWARITGKDKRESSDEVMSCFERIRQRLTFKDANRLLMT